MWREQPVPFFRLEFVCEGDWGELRGVQDFVGVGVADAADQTWIGESALEGAVLERERGAKAVQIGGEDFDATGIDALQVFFAADNVERGAALAACFGKDERASGKVEGARGLAGRPAWRAAGASGAVRRSSGAAPARRSSVTPIAIRLPMRRISTTVRPSTWRSEGRRYEGERHWLSELLEALVRMRGSSAVM